MDQVPLEKTRLSPAVAYFINSPPAGGVLVDMVLVPDVLTVDPADEPAATSVLSSGISLNRSRRVSSSISLSICTLTGVGPLDPCRHRPLLSLKATTESTEE